MNDEPIKSDETSSAAAHDSVTLREWEGVVESVHEGHMAARIVDRRDPSARELVEIDLAQIAGETHLILKAPSTRPRDDMTEPDNDPTAPSTIFLLGPPGVGKSTLGSRACTELGLEFLDLGATGVQPPADTDVLIERLRSRASSGAADVIELPWPLQQENRALRLARRLGVTLLLWAHPEDMHARSGLDKPFVTPVPRLKTRGGFGRNGTGCKEFRRLDRACEEVLLLVDVPRDEAVDALTDYIELLVSEHQQSPVEREGLLAWIDDWHQDHDADPQASRVIVEAMAAYLRHLRAEGRSPRSVRAVVADLNAAGHLVCAYDAPDADKALSSFHAPPWEFAYRRKFSESDALVARYRRSLEGFAQFLDDRDA